MSFAFRSDYNESLNLERGKTMSYLNFRNYFIFIWSLGVCPSHHSDIFDQFQLWST